MEDTADVATAYYTQNCTPNGLYSMRDGEKSFIKYKSKLTYGGQCIEMRQRKTEIQNTLSKSRITKRSVKTCARNSFPSISLTCLSFTLVRTLFLAVVLLMFY